MRKTICGLLVAATTILATLTTFTSCDLETSSAAGDFNGLWHLIRIDTLATGGVLDLKNEKRFWAFQNKLMQGDDKSGNHDKILLRKVHTLPMQTAISTIHTFLITIMTLAQYHDSLAEYPSVGIILANERLKENVATHILEQ